ncbi:MAG: hypothetical protein Q9202_001742 [Teloschistes flavicans]
MYSVAIDKMYQIQELSAALPFALSIGFHIDDMSQDSQFLQDSYDFLKWITVSQALAWCSVMAVKFSFLFLFRKLIEHECALPSGVARELRHGVAQTVMDVVSDLLISAEIGVILASISTYRAFYVSRRRSDDIRAGTSRGHQKYRFLPTRQIVKRFFASSPRPSTPRERSSPEDKWQDENARHPMGSLPQIPSAHLTGMRTFIEGHGQWIDSSRIMGSQGIEEIDDDWPLRKEDHNALEQV